jgi:hypothetical protein
MAKIDRQVVSMSKIDPCDLAESTGANVVVRIKETFHPDDRMRLGSGRIVPDGIDVMNNRGDMISYLPGKRVRIKYVSGNEAPRDITRAKVRMREGGVANIIDVGRGRGRAKEHLLFSRESSIIYPGA